MPENWLDYANLADGTEALTLIRRMNLLYDQTGRAFRVEEVAGGWQLRTRRKFANWLRRLPHVPTRVATVGTVHGDPGGGGVPAAGGASREWKRSAAWLVVRSFAS